MKKSGTFLAHDQSFSPISLTWQVISGKTIELDETIKAIAPLLIPTYLQQEFEFAQKQPELVAQDFMLKSVAPLLAHAPIDWQRVKEEIKKILTDFFASVNWSHYSTDEDCNIFVIACDQTMGENIGVIQFLIRPEFDLNNVKAALFGVIPTARNRGIEELLLSSIFKLKPETIRLFLHTRSTNQTLINRCLDWGFKPFPGPLAHWTDLEYLIADSKPLQLVADKVKIQD